ncbi:zinc finger protein 25-like [Hyposmocoma kahamanoa]|uniref:zinc finger protein 25-like n=1 Tax=Hyposmocoma kahamanoa TaxID=1477025 RepID=UPI000E6D6FA0|nr:zinc finger protein 25-like [Hyposmocoma kahamanoa]
MPPKRKKAVKASDIDINIKKVKVEDSGSNITIKEEKVSPESKKKKGRVPRIHNKPGIRKSRPIFACDKCTKRYRFKDRYLQHLRNEHSILPNAVKCTKCPALCPNKTILKAHMGKYHDRDIFKCPHCQKQFVRHAHVLRHMAQKGCDGRGIASFPCEICDACFSRKDNLMVHLKMQHISPKEFKCKQCSYSTRKFSKLLVHVQKIHTDKPLKLECGHCGKTTGSRASMVKHLEIHGEKKYSCDVCGYSTFTIEVMRRHVLTHVLDKPYKCDVCSRSFIQRSQLDRHLQRHVGKKCPQCDRFFPTEVDVIVHLREHKNGEKEFKCPIENCDNAKVFPSERALKTHVKKHMLLRPYSCEVCGRQSRTELEMRRHLQHHTLERARRCMYCVAARAYVRGEQLVRHVRKVHPQVFNEHLRHVRRVLNVVGNPGRVRKSELDAILNVLDAEADRILQDYGEGVLYGGMQETDGTEEVVPPTSLKIESNPLMSEEELAENLKLLLSHLIDKDLLEFFGWPEETVDRVLEKVIDHCGAKPADREKWSRVQCLRENSKHLFLYVVEDKNIARMLDTHTIDQVIQDILIKISDDAEAEKITAD